MIAQEKWGLRRGLFRSGQTSTGAGGRFRCLMMDLVMDQELLGWIAKYSMHTSGFAATQSVNRFFGGEILRCRGGMPAQSN